MSNVIDCTDWTARQQQFRAVEKPFVFSAPLEQENVVILAEGGRFMLVSAVVGDCIKCVWVNGEAWFRRHELCLVYNSTLETEYYP